MPVLDYPDALRGLDFLQLAEEFYQAYDDLPSRPPPSWPHEFWHRYAKVDPPYHVHQVHPTKLQEYREAVEAEHRRKTEHVRRAVVASFLEEEMAHIAIDTMFPWWDTRPGLSPARPCRPEGGYTDEVDDEVVSDIGKSLLTLAARRTAA
jgi:hypothetical protein